MGAIWVISDTHFGHGSMLGFTIADPSYRCPEEGCDWACRKTHPQIPARHFLSVEEMDEFMVERWNRVVRPQDHIYHLGDVCMRKKHLSIVKRLNGKKRLLRGNHDIFKMKDYLMVGFQEIHGCRVLDNMVFTHIPIHPFSLGRFDANVHGHVHLNGDIPGRYVNVCVEKTGYRPLTLEEIRGRIPREGAPGAKKA